MNSKHKPICRRRWESKAHPANGWVFADETPLDNRERLYWHRLNSALDELCNPEQGEIIEELK